MVKIDEQGRIIIPKEIREKKRLRGEVEIEVVKEGILIKPKTEITWNEIFKSKFKINWNNVKKLDLSEENLDKLWI